MYEGVPKYYAIKKYIVDMINSGNVPENHMIPSERELILEFGVSRITVRKAIDDLVNEGYLYKVQGKGTYVKEDDEYTQDLFSITSCTEDIKKMGMKATRKTISQELIKADQMRIRRLKINEGEDVLCLQRVYYADNDAVNYTISYLPESIFPNINNYDFSKHSMYDIMENRYDVEITKATRTVEAIIPNEEICDYLHMKKGLPVILFRATTYGIVKGIERPVETFKCYYRSDKFKFYINQVR